jgi:hypothetical protein
MTGDWSVPPTMRTILLTDTFFFYKLRETVSRVQDVSETIAVVAGNLQTASKGINDSTNPAGTLLHDRQLAENMKSTLSNLKAATIKLNEDPEALRQ